jgi:phage-related protein
MIGITFGELHSYEDLNLILSEKEIGAPSVKKKLVEIEGADGSIDYTDFFGGPKYGDVTHKFTFSTLVPRSDFLSHYSMVKNALHGKKLRIALDGDPSFYYVGRCFVSSFKDEKGIGKIEVECECEPYKYKTAKTVVTRAVDGAESVTLTNSRKRAVPEITITTEASLNLVYGYNVWDLGSGSYTLPELELAEGTNTVTVTGTGSIRFEWQEATL